MYSNCSSYSTFALTTLGIPVSIPQSWCASANTIPIHPTISIHHPSSIPHALAPSACHEPAPATCSLYVCMYSPIQAISIVLYNSKYPNWCNKGVYIHTNIYIYMHISLYYLWRWRWRWRWKPANNTTANSVMLSSLLLSPLLHFFIPHNFT